MLFVVVICSGDDVRSMYVPQEPLETPYRQLWYVVVINRLYFVVLCGTPMHMHNCHNHSVHGFIVPTLLRFSP